MKFPENLGPDVARMHGPVLVVDRDDAHGDALPGVAGFAAKPTNQSTLPSLSSSTEPVLPAVLDAVKHAECLIYRKEFSGRP